MNLLIEGRAAWSLFAWVAAGSPLLKGRPSCLSFSPAVSRGIPAEAKRVCLHLFDNLKEQPSAELHLGASELVVRQAADFAADRHAIQCQTPLSPGLSEWPAQGSLCVSFLSLQFTPPKTVIGFGIDPRADLLAVTDHRI